MIYNDNAGAVMGPQTDDTTAPSLTGVEATPKGSGIEVGNGGLIFTVHTDGTYYTFENQGKFLAHVREPVRRLERRVPVLRHRRERLHQVDAREEVGGLHHL